MTMTTLTQPIPALDLSKNTIVDVDFSKGILQDTKNPKAAVTAVGQPQLTTDPEVTGKVAKFDGQSGYLLPYTNDRFAQLASGTTIEAYFKDDGAQAGEHEIFSNQESGGLGLGVHNGQVIFYAHVGKGYKEPKSKLRPGKWVHAVGVYDQQGHTAKLYLDGKLVSSVDAPGTLNGPQGTGTANFVIGGDSGKNNRLQYPLTGTVQVARLYDRALTDAEVSGLNQVIQRGKHESVAKKQVGQPGLFGANDVAIGHTYGLNVHVREAQLGGSDAFTTEMRYDASKFDFVSANQTLGGNDVTKVEVVAPGQIKITTTAKLSPSQFERYDQTRLAHINLKAKASGKAWLYLRTLKADGKTPDFASQAVTIHARDAQDYNGDGVIGIGDLALAPGDEKGLIASKSEIKPYKHVVVLTTDGGGNPWDPKGMYYAHDNRELAQWTTDPAILAKRKNTYTLDLFNKKFAMSTTAHSVNPAVSAQNYTSMLHGRPWETLPQEYRVTNGSAEHHYFADFSKTKPEFASVFKVLQQHNPHQGTAAFAEWKQILNGITEPDAPVMTQPSAKLKSFDDVADYIGKPEFTNTSLVYMQSDYMDGQGHGHGWYNDNYWQQYAKYDDLFKKVMDKLEATGHAHDTLVIANADHGGHGQGHGQDRTEPNENIFLAMGGETIDSGRRLQGGSNADISALVLDALKVPKPNYMLGQVFDKTAFLAQTDLKKKHREVEGLKLTHSDQRVAIKLTNPQKNHTTRAIEMHLDLAGRSIDKIDVPTGTKIVQQTVAEGMLKLVLSFDKQPTTDLALIKLTPAKVKTSKLVTLQQSMLGTSKGEEVLVDLDNDTKLEADKDLVAVKPGQTDTTKPGTEGKPGMEGKPGTDGKPGTEGKPGTDDKSGTDGKPGTDGKLGSDDKSGSNVTPSSESKKTASSMSNKFASWLPQTGEQVQTVLSVIGGVLLAISGGVFIWWRRQR
ncbi:LamG-like jellyroll fold domain-containing protein [Lactiplantibacillus daoliensis]|uniref:LamG-like jellyroll fold domain-containing protein n=2 Tax=Lactiplantibacillus daoliensis TaxID=2559916 RepID=A0ABW1UKN6_9LACO